MKELSIVDFLGINVDVEWENKRDRQERHREHSDEDGHARFTFSHVVSRCELSIKRPQICPACRETYKENERGRSVITDQTRQTNPEVAQDWEDYLRNFELHE